MAKLRQIWSHWFDVILQVGDLLISLVARSHFMVVMVVLVQCLADVVLSYFGRISQSGSRKWPLDLTWTFRLLLSSMTAQSLKQKWFLWNTFELKQSFNILHLLYINFKYHWGYRMPPSLGGAVSLYDWQCDQIGRFSTLCPVFQSPWQQLFYQKL